MARLSPGDFAEHMPIEGGDELVRAVLGRLQRWWDSLTDEQKQAVREQSEADCKEHRRRFLSARKR